MCKAKRYKNTPNVRIDKCMKVLIENLSNVETLACCCGHLKYHMTIIINIISSNSVKDIISGVEIPRTRNFYKRDKQGYYFIPEVEEYWKK